MLDAPVTRFVMGADAWRDAPAWPPEGTVFRDYFLHSGGAANPAVNLQEGIVRARYRESLRRPTPITPDEVYAYRIELGPTAYRFRAGHRLRVQVSSSDFPQWDRNLNTGGQPGTEGAAHARVATQSVLHEGSYASRITLPIVER